MIKKKTINKEDKIVVKPDSHNLDQIKEELTKYINEIVNDKFIKEIDNANKGVIREKNKKILTKNMLITFLLLIIVFLIYLLYDANYFARMSNGEKTNIIDNSNLNIVNDNNKENNSIEIEEIKKPTLEELKETYSMLLDNITISEKSKYIEEFYSGKLTDELCNYLTLNNIDFKNLLVDDNYNVIDEGNVKKEYARIFNREYVSTSFDYNGVEVRYIKRLSSYITDAILNKESSNIKREITNIVIDNDNIMITTIEGIVNNNKVYNVTTNEEIGEFNKDILKYKDKLTELTYIFNDNKLITIKK